jgi:Mrp family chromosome partitioning ATPase
MGCVVGAVVLGLIATLLMTPQYTAEATLEIQRESSSIVSVGSQEAKATVFDPEFYETQYGILKSQTLAERVATDLNLYNSPDFFRVFSPSISEKWFPNGRQADPKASTRADRIRLAGDILSNRIKVNPVRLSRLVRISFTSPDPQLSKRIVDAWSVKFIQISLERRYGATSYARNFLETRLAQLRTRIDQSQRQLVDYASREGIVNLPGTAATAGQVAQPERPLVADNLSTLNQELAQAIADRVSAESRLNAAGGQVNEALSNPAISSLRQKRADLSADYARMLVQFEPSYPGAVALRQQIAQLDRAIATEEGRVSGSLRQTYQSAAQREAALLARVNAAKQGVLDFRRRSIQYDIIRRDVDTNQQLYDALLQRYKEIGVSGGVGINNITVVDGAELPQTPSSPKLVLNLAIALLVGLLLGAGLAMALEQMNQGFDNPDDVGDTLDLPLLGTIPKVTSSDLITELQDRKSAVSEAYLSLQTTLAFATDHGVPRVLAITSSRPAEGKSVTSYAIAISLARAGRRTVLVDADMRSPSVHDILGMANTSGVSNFLAGDNDLMGLLRETAQPDFMALTAGPQPPSAPDLLSGERLSQLIDQLLGIFDNIVIDIPPVLGLADAPLIGNRAEAVMMVVEAHSTQKNVARVAVRRLAMSQVPLVGAVLTKLDPSRTEQSYGYSYDYGYGSAVKS